MSVQVSEAGFGDLFVGGSVSHTEANSMILGQESSCLVGVEGPHRPVGRA